MGFSKELEHRANSKTTKLRNINVRATVSIESDSEVTGPKVQCGGEVPSLRQRLFRNQLNLHKAIRVLDEMYRSFGTEFEQRIYPTIIHTKLNTCQNNESESKKSYAQQYLPKTL